jgi:hypothetical protein
MKAVSAKHRRFHGCRNKRQGAAVQGRETRPFGKAVMHLQHGWSAVSVNGCLWRNSGARFWGLILRRNPRPPGSALIRRRLTDFAAMGDHLILHKVAEGADPLGLPQFLGISEEHGHLA